jgi:two-component system chemotaxis response regulator CheB
VSAGAVRVLVVDDSAFARKVMREVLGESPRIQVVGAARDGLEALELIAELAPDVLTLDLVMPNLDGLGVLRALPRVNPPRVVVVSVSDADSALGVEALTAGAFDVVHKPTALATGRLYELRGELIAKVLAAAEARVPVAREGEPAASAPIARAGKIELVVIGASTGGPQALTRLLAALPATTSAPIAIALHIPAGYTHAFGERLDRDCALGVSEAEDGAELRPGHVLIAPGGGQMLIERREGRLCVATRPAGAYDYPYAPSVDLLFASAATAVGPGVLAVVLTGMGDDGLAGARAVRAAGGTIFAEAESSCVVYGMPRCVRESGLADAEAPIERMGALILAQLGG